MEARDAALAAVRADGLELRKVGEFRADKDGQLASWKQQAGWILVDVQHWAGISDSDCWISIMFSLCQSSVESQEVVLAAVQHTGMALCYASHTLQDDIEAQQT